MDTPTQDTHPTSNNEGARIHKPGELYNETFNEVLSGLLYALKMHQGALDLVTLDEIIEGSSINPITLEHYYSSSKTIMYEVLSDLQAAIHTAEVESFGYEPKDAIQILLIRLAKYPLHLKVILATDNKNAWEKNLKSILKRIASDWHTEDDATWNEVFTVFCFQFHLVIKAWSRSDFDTQELPIMVRHVMAWIEGDGVYLINITAA